MFRNLSLLISESSKQCLLWDSNLVYLSISNISKAIICAMILKVQNFAYLTKLLKTPFLVKLHPLCGNELFQKVLTKANVFGFIITVATSSTNKWFWASEYLHCHVTEDEYNVTWTHIYIDDDTNYISFLYLHLKPSVLDAMRTVLYKIKNI